MSFKIIIESLKFYKIKYSKPVKVFFVLLILLRAFMTMAPVGDRDFKFLASILDRSFLNNLSLALPTRGNLLILGIYLAGMLIAMILGLFYAESIILENESYRQPKSRLSPDDLFMIPINKELLKRGQPQDSVSRFFKITFFPSEFKRNISGSENNQFRFLKTVMGDFFRKIPAFMLLIIMLLVVAVLSAYLFMIPFLVIGLMLFFVPLNLTYGKNKLVQAMELSYAQTKGAKLSIFFTLVMHGFLFQMLQNFLALLAGNYHYSFLTLEAFLFAVEVLAVAKLYAMFYQMLALRQPFKVT